MGDDCARLENYEMLKALYDFKATFAKTLSFRENDHFVLHQTNAKQRNWWQVIDSNGQIGYIPSNYVATVKVQPRFLIDFLDDCIKRLSGDEDGDEGVPSNGDARELVRRLVEKRRRAELAGKPKKKAPSPPNFGTTSPGGRVSTSDSDSKTRAGDARAETRPSRNREDDPAESKSRRRRISGSRRDSDDENRSEPTPPRRGSSETVGNERSEIEERSFRADARRSPDDDSPAKDDDASSLRAIDSRAAYRLLDEVRRNTRLSYEMSRIAVEVVVSELRRLFPNGASRYFDAVLGQLRTPVPVSTFKIEETYDANRLKVIFTELTSCKEDSQQRGWMLYEDESVIVEYIKELTSILTNADANVTRHALRQDRYDGISTLVEYYQMEARWTIRQLLLQSFGVMCSLDPVALTIMLNSVLPMELARDMRSDPRNVPKLNYSSLLLAMIFSMGESMPVTHLEQLGPDFVSFLLEYIENPPDTDLEEQIPDQFLSLVLSYNLQFGTSENVVVKALGETTLAKAFTQKILLLLNREEDPVRIFDHEPAPPHSVLKLFVDLFGNESTASLFYTNDVKVLIDIVLRQLFDIPPGDKRRYYLELCRRVLRTSGYNEHRHRSEDLLKCFTRIFCEETPESQEDQHLVREIGNEFPNLFKM